jgi:5-methylcytosine-specific restriction endonuclease McrA
MTSLPILNPSVQFPDRMGRWFRRRRRIRTIIREKLWLEDPHCRYCRRPLAGPWAGVLDHATPRSRGGKDHANNAILACRACDRAKGDRTVSEWRRDLLAGLFSIGLPPVCSAASTTKLPQRHKNQ